MLERDLFIEALQMEDNAERSAFLDVACAGNEELRRRVERLLEEHQRPGDFVLDTSPQGAAETTLASPSVGPGMQLGPYKLVQQLGEGAMGVVFMAEQTEPVERCVAIKIVKAGLESRQVLARFDAERHALAVLDHPNIARVLDAGTTSTGRPYFVMELVKGEPITNYCDAHQLTPRERLELFIPVCEAVQHAHQKGIIHRDIKPSNVLIALYDGKPVPKVIDFGVAKATGRKLTEQTLFTEFGSVVGTLEYMSPEQASLNQLDIDTRSDIYSLGVLLYELLTGTTPLERKRLNRAAVMEMLRFIREVEPQRPSARLTTTEELPTIAANRGLEPRKLSAQVHGELDWIVMKCLEKERDRRYGTANGLALDIKRFLANEQVLACPPSRAYRLRKLIKRNRTAIALSLVLAASLMIGTVVSIWQAVRANHAEATAEDQRTLAEQHADEATQATVTAEAARKDSDVQRLRAEANLRKARQAIDEYFTLVSQSKLFDVPNLQPLRKDLLESALHYYQTLVHDRSDDPALLVDLAVAHLRLAQVYHELDRNDESTATFATGLDLVEQLRHKFPAATQEHHRLAGFWKGQRGSSPSTAIPNDPVAAERTLKKFIGIWEILAREHPTEVAFQNDLAAGYATLASLQASAAAATGSFGVALSAMTSTRKAIAIWERLNQADPDNREYRENLVTVLHEFSFHLGAAGSRKEARRLADRALELTERLVTEFPSVPHYRWYLALNLNARGHWLEDLGRPREAAQDYYREFQLAKGLATDFPSVAQYTIVLTKSARDFIVLAPRIDWPEGLKTVCQELTPIHERLKRFAAEPPSSPENRARLAEAFHELGDAFYDSGEPGLAESVLKRCIAQSRQIAVELPHDASSLSALAHGNRMLAIVVEGQPGRWADAESLFRDAATIYAQILAKGPRDVGLTTFLAMTYRDVGRVAALRGLAKESEDAYRNAVDLLSKALLNAPNVFDYRCELAYCHSSLATLLNNTGRKQDAVEAYHRAADLSDRLAADLPTDPASRDRIARAQYDLAESLKAAKQSAEAEKHYRQAATIWEKLGSDYPAEPIYRRQTFRTRACALGPLLEAEGRSRDAQDVYCRASEYVSHFSVSELANDEVWTCIDKCYGNLLSLLKKGERPNEATTPLREWCSLYRKIGDRLADNASSRCVLAQRYASIAKELVEGTYPPQECEQICREGLSVVEGLSTKYPNDAHLSQTLANLKFALDTSLKRQNRSAQAAAPKERQPVGANQTHRKRK
jgi:serine/threonine protein kinase